MFKKILFTFLLLVCAYNVAVVGYRIFEPRTPAVSEDNTSYLDYETLPQYLCSYGEGTTHLLLFYSSHDTDSVYVKDSLLPSIEKDTSITVSTTVEIVDVSQEDLEDRLDSLEENWDIHSIPAFAAVTVEDDTPVVLNTLEESEGKTLTTEELINWIEENEIQGAVIE